MGPKPVIDISARRDQLMLDGLARKVAAKLERASIVRPPQPEVFDHEDELIPPVLEHVNVVDTPGGRAAAYSTLNGQLTRNGVPFDAGSPSDALAVQRALPTLISIAQWPEHKNWPEGTTGRPALPRPIQITLEHADGPASYFRRFAQQETLDATLETPKPISDLTRDWQNVEAAERMVTRALEAQTPAVTVPSNVISLNFGLST